MSPFLWFSSSLFIWQTFNALVILRVIIKYFIEHLKEDEVLKQFEYGASEGSEKILDQMIHALIDIINNVEQRYLVERNP